MIIENHQPFRLKQAASALACVFILGCLAQKAMAETPPGKTPPNPAARATETVKTIKKQVETQLQTIQQAAEKPLFPAAKTENNPQVSQWANDAVVKIEAAQTSIERNQLPEAKQQLTEAQTLLESIQQSKPTAKAITQVESVRKQVETGQLQTDTDLAPLDREIVAFETVTPAPKAKEHLKLAKQSLQQKNKSNATEHLVNVESQLIYAEADLPVSRTKQDVLGAQTLLDQGKAKEAHKMLTDSLNHIQVLVVETKDSKQMNLPPTAKPAP